MNKQRFSQVVREFHGLSTEDRNKLHDLVKAYPYSQIIHTLVAKANNDAGTEISQQTLGYAAMYATDRVVLKRIIESQPPVNEPIATADTVEQEVAEQPSTNAQEQEKIDVTKRKVTVNEERLPKKADHLVNEVWSDLEALKKSKAAYFENEDTDAGTAGEDNVDSKPATTTVKKASPRKKTTTTAKATGTATKTTAAAKATGTTAKTTAAAKATGTAAKTTAAKKTTTKATTTKKTPAKDTTKKTASKKATASKTTTGTRKKTTTTKSSASKTSAADEDTATGEAKAPSTTKASASKKKADEKPKNLQIKTQKEIIEKFIDKEPRISPKTIKASTSRQKDLSETSTAFGENLVSENLAQILIAQGKKEKALDIYKKLIWKFPQKKSYFAALIEDLQN